MRQQGSTLAGVTPASIATHATPGRRHDRFEPDAHVRFVSSLLGSPRYRHYDWAEISHHCVTMGLECMVVVLMYDR